MTELPGADAALAATPGAALATAREANGLSVAQVAEQMRISPRQVEAIEADRYSELPGAVFVRGFVRNYARLLKLDPVPLLHALEPALGGDDVPLRAHEIAGALPETTRRGHGRLWLGVIVLVVAAAALAATYEWWRSRAPAIGGGIGSMAPGQTPATPQPPPPAAAAPGQATVPLSPERMTDSPAAPSGEATQSRGAAGGLGAPAPQSPAAPQALPGAPQSPADLAQSPAAAPRSAATGAGAMQMVFVAESWIEIRDGEGNVQFSGTVPAGSARSFDVQPPVDVVVGNASGVRITYNGQPFDLASHANRNIARFRLE
jgi:cytoskeleton protein RodZ